MVDKKDAPSECRLQLLNLARAVSSQSDDPSMLRLDLSNFVVAHIVNVRNQLFQH